MQISRLSSGVEHVIGNDGVAGSILAGGTIFIIYYLNCNIYLGEIILSDNLFSWKNKVVAITGGANGIGKAIAIAAYNKGAKISVSDINEKDLSEVKNEHDFLTTCRTPMPFKTVARLGLGARGLPSALIQT